MTLAWQASSPSPQTLLRADAPDPAGPNPAGTSDVAPLAAGPIPSTAVTEDATSTTTNPYQQAKRDISRILGEPVAWVSRAHAGRRHRKNQSASLLLARAEHFIAVFPTGDEHAPVEPEHRRFQLAQITAAGPRRLKAVDTGGRVHWLHLDPNEPSARAFLTRPRTFHPF